MKYRFETVVIDTDLNQATFDSGQTVDIVGGEFALGDERFRVGDLSKLRGKPGLAVLTWGNLHDA